MKEFVIGHRQEGQRLDKYLFKILDLAPHSFVYKMLRKKNIDLNGRKAAGSERLAASDVIRIWLSDETFAKFSSQGGARDAASSPAAARQGAVKIEVIYEDADILIVNKPAGVLSQKAAEDDNSMNDRILAYLLESGQLNKADLIDFKPSVCNRLDRNTSGLLLAGKTVSGLQALSDLLRTRDLKKYYRCIAVGNLTKEQHLKGYLTKDARRNRAYITDAPTGPDSRPVETYVRPLEQFHGACYLEVGLLTGRSHQIRAHLSSIGHPLLGDVKYAQGKVTAQTMTGVTRPMLHAYRMEFPDGRVFTADLPADFEEALQAYRG